LRQTPRFFSHGRNIRVTSDAETNILFLKKNDHKNNSKKKKGRPFALVYFLKRAAVMRRIVCAAGAWHSFCALAEPLFPFDGITPLLERHSKRYDRTICARRAGGDNVSYRRSASTAVRCKKEVKRLLFTKSFHLDSFSHRCRNTGCREVFFQCVIL
jgi:hypothetical protein